VAGKKFQMLTVTNEYEQRETKGGRRTYWKCICDCGNEVWIERSCIGEGKQKSCGCLNKPKENARRKQKLYHLFYSMKERCYNTKNPKYHLYGRKGIKICDEWLNDYSMFEQWAYENGYNDGLSIDRIDSNKDYCPENCRWITLGENSARANEGRHKNKTKLGTLYAISPDGEYIEFNNISKFEREYGINRSTIRNCAIGYESYAKTHKTRSGWEFGIVQNNT
jgi:hypothetical protein